MTGGNVLGGNVLGGNDRWRCPSGKCPSGECLGGGRGGGETGGKCPGGKSPDTIYNSPTKNMTSYGQLGSIRKVMKQAYIICLTYVAEFYIQTSTNIRIWMLVWGYDGE